MPESMIQMLERRTALTKDMRAILDTAEAEDRDLAGEESTRFDKMGADVDALDERIDRLRKQEARERKATEDRAPEVTRTDDAAPVRFTETPEYREAFFAYLRHGTAELPSEQREILRRGYDSTVERRDFSKGTTTAGGFTVPQSFYGKLYEVLEEEISMRAIGPTVIQTEGGEDLPIPKVSAHGADATPTAEGTGLTSTDDTFAQTTLKAWTYPALKVVSWQLLEDTGVDLEGFLARELAREIAYGQNANFVTGDGSSKPRGVTIDAAVGKTGASGQTGTVTADDILDLVYSVKRPYRKRGKFLMNDGSIKIVRKLKDGENRYLWTPSGTGGLTPGEPDQLAGYPVFADEDVATMAASAKSILFGDFTAYYIRDVKQMAIRRLDERYAEKLQSGFLAWLRSDGALIDTAAVKHYANAAS